MGMKKGQLEGIDQRHYFREQVFASLTWSPDDHKAHLERASAPFHLILEGIYSGRFELRLTHNTDTASKTYKQKNFMTHLHWDAAIRIVANRKFMGRIMRIYRIQSDTTEFLIEID